MADDARGPATDEARGPIPPTRDPHIATREDAGETAPSFRLEPYPSTYGTPRRAFLRRALKAYVLGHDRGIETERKLELADRAVETDRADRYPSGPEEGELDVEGVSATSGGHPESVDRDSPASSTDQARFGVAVPERLSFHRGPDVWRDRLERREATAPSERLFRREAKRPEEMPRPGDAPRLESTPGDRDEG